MEPLTIVVSFDVGEQVVPGGIPGFVASLVHEFSFQSAEATFHRSIVPTISLPAHGLNHPGRAENLAVIGGGVLAAAIGMMDQRAAAFAAGWPWSGLQWSIPPACGHASPSRRFCGGRDRARGPDRATLPWLARRW